jgi:L-iditol 2-dehydrogenase
VIVPNPSAVLYGPGDVRIEDRPVPEPGPGEVQVEVTAIGVCGSDVHYYDHGRIGTRVVEDPMVLGHESAGRISAVGAGVDPGRVGQRVAMEPGVPCGHCRQCRAGRYNLCEGMAFFATPPINGSIARFVTIAADFAHPVPDELDDVQAAMAEPVSVGIWACRRAGVTAGERVLVTGAGPIGLFTAQVARAFGAASVTVTDLSDHRLAVAAQLGLIAVRAGAPLDERFDVLIECSGSSRALQSALPLVDRAGRVVLVGMGEDSVAFDVPLIQTRELWITGTFRYANTYPTALALLAAGSVQVAPVVTHEFPLHRTEEALLVGRTDPTALKAIVRP